MPAADYIHTFLPAQRILHGYARDTHNGLLHFFLLICLIDCSSIFMFQWPNICLDNTLNSSPATTVFIHWHFHLWKSMGIVCHAKYNVQGMNEIDEWNYSMWAHLWF